MTVSPCYVSKGREKKSYRPGQANCPENAKDQWLLPLHSLWSNDTVFGQKEINQEGWALSIYTLEGKLKSAKSKQYAIIIPVVLL